MNRKILSRELYTFTAYRINGIFIKRIGRKESEVERRVGAYCILTKMGRLIEDIDIERKNEGNG